MIGALNSMGWIWYSQSRVTRAERIEKERSFIQAGGQPRTDVLGRSGLRVAQASTGSRGLSVMLFGKRALELQLPID